MSQSSLTVDAAAESVLQLRARRSIMVARLESLKASLDECRQNIEDLDVLVLNFEALRHNVELTAVGVAATTHVGTPEVTVRASGNPKKELVAQEVHAYLKTAGKPLSRKELFDKLADNGFNIRGANPEMVLSTMLWRTADEFGFERLATGGYGLKAWRSSDFDDLLGDAGEKSQDIFD